MEKRTRDAVSTIISTFSSPHFIEANRRSPSPVFATIVTAVVLAGSAAFVGTGFAGNVGESFTEMALGSRAEVLAFFSAHAADSEIFPRESLDAIALRDSMIGAAQGTGIESLPLQFSNLSAEIVPDVAIVNDTYERSSKIVANLPKARTFSQVRESVVYDITHPVETLGRLGSNAMHVYARVGTATLSEIESVARIHHTAIYGVSDAVLAVGTTARDLSFTLPLATGNTFLATLDATLAAYERGIYGFAAATHDVPNAVVSSVYALGDSTAGVTASLVVSAPRVYDAGIASFSGSAQAFARGLSEGSFAFGAGSRQTVAAVLEAQDAVVTESVRGAKRTVFASVPSLYDLPAVVTDKTLGLIGGAALAIETADTSALSATPLAALDIDRYIPGFLRNATAILARALESALHGVFGPLAGFFGATEEAGLAIIPPETRPGTSSEGESENGETGASVVYNGPVTIIRNEYPTVQYGGVPQSYVDERFDFLRRTLYNRIEDVADDDRFRGEITKSTIVDSDIEGGSITGTSISDSTFTGGTISGASLDVASTSISGELVVSGDADISGSVTASYFTATSTSDVSTFPNLIATNATATNATTTNFFASALRATIATITDAFFTNITATLATLTDAVITNLTATNGTFTNATTTNATSTNLYASSAVLGNATSTNLYVSSARIVSGVIDTLTAPIANLTTAVIATLTATDATLTNATTTNATTTNSLALTYTTANRLLQLNAAGGVIATNLSSWIAGTANQITVTDSGAGGVTLSLPSQIIFGTTEQTTLSSGGATSTFGGGLFAYALEARDYIAGPYILATSTTATSAFSGNIAVGRNTTLGTSASDSLVVNANVSSHFVPSANNTYDLGSVSNNWRTIYVDEVVANNISAASTSIAGTVSETFTLNSDNATADTEDISIVFNRGSASPNALLTWNATADRFEFNMPIYSASGTVDYASTTALTVAGQANIGSLAGAAVSSLTANYLAKWNSGTFINSLIYDSGTQLGIGTNSNLSGAVTANGAYGVQAEGDIFRQYDSGDAAWYPILARYNTANGSYPASTFLFGNGTNSLVGIEEPGGGNVSTFRVRANASTFSGTTETTGLASFRGGLWLENGDNLSWRNSA
ncbi:MAG TPA: hypothetical protein VNU25_03785, partial [Candidatus Paceibacterota bacterium]|nr:hypothetical protein [Candidatus Paceibacterota bacterium]